MKYSEKEIEMFTKLGHKDFLIYPVDAFALYNIAMHRAFICDKKGPEVEALRRALNALAEDKIHRMTKEFDDLISFEKPECEEFRCPNCKRWLGNYIREDKIKICVNCKQTWH